jgi:poly-gamma-glutamate synthesis protein (capsule biosynthesis protein)
VSIGAVGDIMFHDIQLLKAYEADTKTFRFTNIFKYFQPYIEENDLSFANFETTLAGPVGNQSENNKFSVYGYSGYPNFNSPDSVLDAIKTAGFDFLSTANNHSLDRSFEGMKRTIQKLDEAGIGHTGTFLDQTSRKPYELISTKGISFAIVNYTYGTNGIQLKNEHMELINTLDMYQEENLQRLYEDVSLAEKSEADYVICMLHYGNEYQAFEDNQKQKKISYEVIRRGADIVFGGHPHVLEPIEIIKELDGIQFQEPKIIIYSLGNFLASQRYGSHETANTDIGVLFNLYFRTVDKANPRLTGIGFLPSYTIFQGNNITPIPILNDSSLLKEHGIDLEELLYTKTDRERIEMAKKYALDHLLTYEVSKKTLGNMYNDQGIYRYDFLDF